MGLDRELIEPTQGASVARLLEESVAGNRRAAAELLPLVYEQLRQLAHHHVRQERPDHTLQATALVHEAYLRLAGENGSRTFEGRWHFYAAAAEAMRRILVDAARRRRRLKRGGDRPRVDLDRAGLTFAEPPDELLALDEGLSLLAERHPEKAELVKLRYFGGLTIEEASKALDVSLATAYRQWAYARAWLYRHVTAELAPGDREVGHGHR